MVTEREKMITLDFSSVKERTPLAEGIYELEIKDAEEKASKSSGNMMLAVTFKELTTGTLIWENYSYVEAALFKLKKLLDAIGIDASGEVSLDPTDLIGVTVKAKVIQDTYNDQITNRVKDVFAN